MAKSYKLVTTLSDGTEINAGTFEVPDASASGLYHHEIYVSFTVNENNTGYFALSYISVSSTPVRTQSLLTSYISSVQNSYNGIAVTGHATLSAYTDTVIYGVRINGENFIITYGRMTDSNWYNVRLTISEITFSIYDTVTAL